MHALFSGWMFPDGTRLIIEQLVQKWTRVYEALNNYSNKRRRDITFGTPSITSLVYLFKPLFHPGLNKTKALITTYRQVTTTAIGLFAKIKVQ